MSEPPKLSRLSARQEQCVRLTAFRTDKEIAAHLGISEATVKKHVHDACQKLGVNRRKAALAMLEPEGSGYPKDPMAEPTAIRPDAVASERRGEDIDHGRRLETVVAANAERSAAAGSTAPVDPAFPVGRFGYRPPSGGAVVRLVVSAGLMVVIVALLVTVTGMLGDFQKSVKAIDTAHVQSASNSN